MKKSMSSVVSIFFITLAVVILISFMGYYANYNLSKYIKTVESSKIIEDDFILDKVVDSVDYFVDEDPILYNVIKKFDNLNIFLTFDELADNVVSLDRDFFFDGSPKWNDGVIGNAMNLNYSLVSKENLSFESEYSLGFHYKLNSSVNGDVLLSPMIDIYVNNNNLIIEEKCSTQVSIDNNEWNTFFFIRTSLGFKVYINDDLKKEVVCSLDNPKEGVLTLGNASGSIDNFFITNSNLSEDFGDYFDSLILYDKIEYVMDDNYNTRLYLDNSLNYSFYKKDILTFKELNYVKGESFLNQDEYIVNNFFYFNIQRDNSILITNEAGSEDYSFFDDSFIGLDLAYDFEGPVGLYNYDKSSSNNIDISLSSINSENNDNYLDLNSGNAKVEDLFIDYDDFIIGFRLNLKSNNNVVDTLIEKKQSFIINIDSSESKYSLDFGRFVGNKGNFISGGSQDINEDGTLGDYVEGFENSKVLEYDNWYNVIVSYDENLGSKIYINGILYASSNFLIGDINNNISDLVFNEDLLFNAKIDDFFIIENDNDDLIEDYNSKEIFFKENVVYFLNDLNKEEAYINKIEENQIYPVFDNFRIGSRLESLGSVIFNNYIFNLSFPSSFDLLVSNYDKYKSNKLYLDFSTCTERVNDFLDHDIFLNIDYGSNSPSGLGCSMIGKSNSLSKNFILNVSKYDFYIYLKTYDSKYNILSYGNDDYNFELYRNDSDLFLKFNNTVINFDVNNSWSLLKLSKENDLITVYYNNEYKGEFEDSVDDNLKMKFNFNDGDYLVNSILFVEDLVDKSSEFLLTNSILPIKDFDYDMEHFCSDDFINFEKCNSATIAKYHKFIFNGDNDISLSKFQVIDSNNYLLIKNIKDLVYSKDDIDFYVNNVYQNKTFFWFLDSDMKYSNKLLKDGYIVIKNSSNLVLTTSNGNKFKFN